MSTVTNSMIASDNLDISKKLLFTDIVIASLSL